MIQPIRIVSDNTNNGFFYITNEETAFSILELGYFYSFDFPYVASVGYYYKDIVSYIERFIELNKGRIHFNSIQQIGKMCNNVIFEVDLSGYVVKTLNNTAYVETHMIPISTVKNIMIIGADNRIYYISKKELKDGMHKVYQEKMQPVHQYKLEVQKPQESIDIDHDYNDLESHLMFLHDSGEFNVRCIDGIYILDSLKKRSNKLLYKLPRDKYILFHGTNLEGLKHSFDNGYVQSRAGKNHFEYNKTYFTSAPEYAKFYGADGSHFRMSNEKTDDKYFLLKVDLSNYDVYALTYNDNYEAIVWGGVSVNNVQNIYLCENDIITKELKTEELELLTA